MIYTQRRVRRQKMMRNAIIKQKCKYVAVAIRGFVPEVIAAIAFMIAVFYLFPILWTALFAPITMGVLP